MGHYSQVEKGPDGEDRFIVDRDICARTTGYSPETIRKHLRPLRYAEDTGRALYDQQTVVEILRAAGVHPRPDTRGPRRPAWRGGRRGS